MLETQTITPLQKLQGAWILRWNQRIEESMEHLAQIQVEEEWELLSIDHLTNLTSKDSQETYLEALLLKGSLMRAQGQEQKSSAWFRRILNKNIELQRPQGFRLLFELGLDAWRREDLAQALDFFLLAERKCRNATEQVFTQSNILWCLESLDLERKKMEDKLAHSLNQLSPDAQIQTQNVLEQWTAYKSRQAFYFSMQTPKESNKGQPGFFAKWTYELPYTEKESLLNQNLDGAYLWQGSYRLRTLNGIWSPTDRQGVRVSDAIDRLYLWTWKWLKNLDISKEKIIWTLESILDQLDLQELGKENALLLRNALLWLALLDPSLKKKMPRLLPRIQKISSSNYPLLETEFCLIECLSRPDSSDLVASLNAFPIFALIYKQSKKTSLTYKDAFLPRLQEYLSSRLEILSKDTPDVVVNGQTHEIHFVNQEIKIKSERMTLLFALLEKRPFINFAELGDFRDPRTVYNLIARIRKLTNSKSLRLSDEKIFKGPAWPQVKIFCADDLATTNLEDFNFDIGKNKVIDSEAYLQAAKALLTKSFSRKDFEKALKVSKATACRMLQLWIDKKYLRKEGKARNVQYFWESYD